MIPSQTWFPSSLADRAVWMENFKDTFATYAATLTLSSYVTAVNADNEDFQSIAETREASRTFDRAVATFLRDLTETPVGSPHPVFPTEDFAAPPNDVAAGIFQRIDDLRTLILAQPTCTDAMKTAMRLVGTPQPGIAPEDVKPDIALSAAVHGYLFSIVVSKRYEADDWQVFVRPGNVVEWQLQGSFTGKSADITFNPGGEVPGAVQLEVYVQLRRNNANYGQPSDPAFVTVSP